jgi:hypothetical protein
MRAKRHFGERNLWLWWLWMSLLLLLAGCAGGGGKLAVITQEGALTLVDGQGRVTERVAGDFTRPAWSRDGSQVALLGRDGQSIHRVDAASGQLTEIYRSDLEPPLTLGWSPLPGRGIGPAIQPVLAFDTPGQAVGSRILHLYSLETEGITALDAGPDLRWAWLPNQEILVQAGERRTRFGVNGEILAEEQVSVPDFVPFAPGEWGHLAGVPSPDGRWVAHFSLAEGETVDLSLVNSRTGLERRRYIITPTPAMRSLLAELDRWQEGSRLWSPDSRSLWIAQPGTDGQPWIWRFPASERGAPQPITPGVEASWSWR